MVPKSSGRPFQSADFSRRREFLYSLLGRLPERGRPLSTRTLGMEERGHYILEKLELDLNGLEPVPAFFVKPRSSEGKLPAVLYNHSHGGGYTIGKKEFIEGRPYLQSPPYAELLTELGFAALCIDSWVFGERSHTSESDLFKKMLWQGQVMWGMMLYDALKAVDYLESRSDVDRSRLATLGISMGSTMAWWLAALDERIAVTVDICCLTDFHTLLRQRALDRHGLYYYVPDLLTHFSTAEINALIAPRPHLAIAGLRDPLTPPEGLDLIEAHLDRVYKELNAPANWKLLRYDAGHQETPAAREAIVRFLTKHLA